MKTSDLLRMLADNEDEAESLRETAERLNREAERLRNTDRCPSATVQGSDFCLAHRHRASCTVSSLDPPKAGGLRCAARVALAEPIVELDPGNRSPAADGRWSTG